MEKPYRLLTSIESPFFLRILAEKVPIQRGPVQKFKALYGPCKIGYLKRKSEHLWYYFFCHPFCLCPRPFVFIFV